MSANIKNVSLSDVAANFRLLKNEAALHTFILVSKWMAVHGRPVMYRTVLPIATAVHNVARVLGDRTRKARASFERSIKAEFRGVAAKIDMLSDDITFKPNKIPSETPIEVCFMFSDAAAFLMMQFESARQRLANVASKKLEEMFNLKTSEVQQHLLNFLDRIAQPSFESYRRPQDGVVLHDFGREAFCNLPVEDGSMFLNVASSYVLPRASMGRQLAVTLPTLLYREQCDNNLKLTDDDFDEPCFVLEKYLGNVENLTEQQRCSMSEVLACNEYDSCIKKLYNLTDDVRLDKLEFGFVHKFCIAEFRDNFLKWPCLSCYRNAWSYMWQPEERLSELTREMCYNCNMQNPESVTSFVVPVKFYPTCECFMFVEQLSALLTHPTEANYLNATDSLRMAAELEERLLVAPFLTHCIFECEQLPTSQSVECNDAVSLLTHRVRFVVQAQNASSAAEYLETNIVRIVEAFQQAIDDALVGCPTQCYIMRMVVNADHVLTVEELLTKLLGDDVASCHNASNAEFGNISKTLITCRYRDMLNVNFYN